MGMITATAAQYGQFLRRLLPRGMVWAVSPGAPLALLLDGLGVELARAHNRLHRLVAECDPRTTIEMIAAWERAFGLPDDCAPTPTTIAERQNILHARVIAHGGQGADRLIAIASALGYTATIQEYEMFRVGISQVGVGKLYDFGKAYSFIVAVTAEPALSFQVGISQVGVAGLGTYIPSRLHLECQINRAKPSHTVAEFVY